MNANDTQAQDPMLMQFHRMKAEMATQAGEDAISNVRNVLERALREIDRYAERYAGFTGLSDKAEVMGWTINYVASGILGNCRLDLLAGAKADLAVSAAVLASHPVGE